MVEQFRVGIPLHQRRHGWLYDARSGLLMGLGSDEQKAKYGYNVPFVMAIAGCPYTVVIHKS